MMFSCNIPCGVIAGIKLMDISITSHSYQCFVCVHNPRSPLLENFKYAVQY